MIEGLPKVMPEKSKFAFSSGTDSLGPDSLAPDSLAPGPDSLGADSLAPGADSLAPGPDSLGADSCIDNLLEKVTKNNTHHVRRAKKIYRVKL